MVDALRCFTSYKSCDNLRPINILRSVCCKLRSINVIAMTLKVSTKVCQSRRNDFVSVKVMCQGKRNDLVNYAKVIALTL